MKLKIFDFDSTLVQKPEEYKWDPNDNKEDNDYMESKESLKIDFKIHQKVLDKYKKREENTKYVLLTNRTNKLKDEVIQLLKEKGIEFNYHLFRKEDRSKGNRLIGLIKNLNNNNNIEQIEYYDDKHKHLKDIYRVSKMYDTIKFKINKVFKNYILTC